MTQFHRDAPAGDIHQLHQWSYSDATARLAAAGFASSDVGKVALQVDTSAYYILTDDSPITWQKIGSIDLADARTQVTGTRAAPSSIVAGTGIAFTGSYPNNLWFIQGSGGAVDVSANPQIAAGSFVGQVLTLIGRSSANTVLLEDGTGLSLNGPWEGRADDVLGLIWDGTNWTETYRR
jgi:hypothetical protein